MSQKHIEHEIKELATLSALSLVLSELSSLRIKETRENVLYTRSFITAINSVFGEVLSSYYKKARALAHKKNGEKLTFIAHNGKTVAVFISSTTGLYGPIVQKTFEHFMSEAMKDGVEVTLIGSYGVRLFSGQSTKPYTFFELSDNKEKMDFARIVAHLVQYETIHVYYPQFRNVVSQESVMKEIAAEPKIETSDTQIKYLFEPTLESVLQFFESEIFTSMFESVLEEAQLARHASRMLAMDMASQNIKKKLSHAHLERLRSVHRESDRKQLQSVAAVMAVTRR